jgi:1,4-dihydroxy-2-naphthoyl-CoA synthase
MTLDEQTRLELVNLVKTAVNEAVEAHPLSPEEVHWVRMAIQAEAQRAELRKAIINKTLAGLVWVGIVAAGGWLLDYFTAHWK